MNTSNPERLKAIVRLLSQKKSEIDSYYDTYIFKPFNIDIKNCLVDRKLGDTKRLLDFSFTTRQGSQNKRTITKYEKKKEEIIERLEIVLHTLNKQDWEIRKKYITSLALINLIEGIGQKISSMFIKFLVYYSKDFEGKAELERELFIPFDSHVIRLLFVKFNGDTTNRLKLYNESINQASLYYEMEDIKTKTLWENKLVKLQRNIRDDFDQLKLKEPPIILDYLWYVGSMYCRHQIGDIGCRICFLRDKCETGKTT